MSTYFFLSCAFNIKQLTKLTNSTSGTTVARAKLTSFFMVACSYFLYTKQNIKQYKNSIVHPILTFTFHMNILLLVY